MSHGDLGGYYELLWSLAQHYHYSLIDIEQLYPFERDIYVTMLQEHIRKTEEE
jgi:hypothetical protein